MAPLCREFGIARELYSRSRRPCRGLEKVDYPLHDNTITVTQCGRVCFGRKKIHPSTVFAGQNVGIKQVADKIWLVSFMQYDLGFFDEDSCRLGSAVRIARASRDWSRFAPR